MIPNIEGYMIELFLLLSLIVLSYIDIKFREFPAVLTTGILFIVAMVKIGNLQFGILAFIFALLLMELEFFSGTADLKIVTAMGFMVSEMGVFFLLVILTLIFGTVYKILMIKIVKQKDETAFVPVFLFVYITMLITRLI